MLGPQFFHVSHRQNRESIEQSGLKPNKPWDNAPKGVYVMPEYPNIGHGDDIYEITPSKRTEFHMDPMDPGAWYSRRTINPKDFKRVGHRFEDEHGKEVHWHPEEACKGRMCPPTGNSWEEVDTKHLEK